MIDWIIGANCSSALNLFLFIASSLGKVYTFAPWLLAHSYDFLCPVASGFKWQIASSKPRTWKSFLVFACFLAPLSMHFKEHASDTFGSKKVRNLYSRSTPAENLHRPLQPEANLSEPSPSQLKPRPLLNENEFPESYSVWEWFVAHLCSYDRLLVYIFFTALILKLFSFIFSHVCFFTITRM